MNITSFAQSRDQFFGELAQHVTSTAADGQTTTRLPLPFLGSTIDVVYNTFYKSHVQSATSPPSSSSSIKFTDFTFFAVDESCFSHPADTSSIPSILLCSDAPDFGEAGDDKVRLKTYQYPLNREDPISISKSAGVIELLLQTPSEAHDLPYGIGRDSVSGDDDADAKILKTHPPAYLWPIPPYTMDEDQVSVIATPEQGRLRKRMAIDAVEAGGWIFGVGFPEGGPTGGGFERASSRMP